MTQVELAMFVISEVFESTCPRVSLISYLTEYSNTSNVRNSAKSIRLIKNTHVELIFSLLKFILLVNLYY